MVEIMVPLVGSVMELFLIRDEADEILRSVAERTGVAQPIPIGTMIELPRAALTAARIAEAAEFFFFGTNDFFPFTKEELKQHDPDMFALLETLWNPPAK